PNTLATALWPTAALQIVAANRPTGVAARIIASGAPTAAAGTIPTSVRPNATDPTTNVGSPSDIGSPAAGPETATSATSTTSTSPGLSCADSSAEAPSAVMAASFVSMPAIAGPDSLVPPGRARQTLSLSQRRVCLGQPAGRTIPYSWIFR